MAEPAPAVAPEAVSPPEAAGRLRRLSGLLPGLAVVCALAGIADALGSLVPVIGGPVFGIALGVASGILFRCVMAGRAGALDAGAAFAGKQVLQASVVLLGTGLSLVQVGRTGLASLPVMLVTLTVAFGGALLLGRLLRVGGDVRTLIGVGTGICGASAIASATAVVGAAEGAVAYAIATIFTFNVAAVLLFPAVGHLLGLSQHAFGLWAGTAINDTSSVVAAATTYGVAAGNYGVVVKLTRSLMILPVCIALGALTERRRRRADPSAARSAVKGLPWGRMVPPFLLLFVVASTLDTAGLIPVGWHSALKAVSGYLITVALTGIGLSTKPAAFRAAGPRPLLLGGLLWVALAAASLLAQWASGLL